MSENWCKVAEADELPEGGVKPVLIGGAALAVYRLAGRIYAISDVCTHADACLSDGYIDGENIECPLHQGLFHIPTGKAVAAPASEDLKTYPVKLDGGAVYIEV